MECRVMMAKGELIRRLNGTVTGLFAVPARIVDVELFAEDDLFCVEVELETSVPIQEAELPGEVVAAPAGATTGEVVAAPAGAKTGKRDPLYRMLKPEQREQVRAMLNAGVSNGKIAATMGITSQSVCYYRNKFAGETEQVTEAAPSPF